jgi:hypothetical protein
MTQNIHKTPDDDEDFNKIPEIDLTADPEALAAVLDDLTKNFGDMRRELEEERKRKRRNKDELRS